MGINYPSFLRLRSPFFFLSENTLRNGESFVCGAFNRFENRTIIIFSRVKIAKSLQYPTTEP